jgi:hypothetical protein
MGAADGVCTGGTSELMVGKRELMAVGTSELMVGKRELMAVGTSELRVGSKTVQVEMIS